MKIKSIAKHPLAIVVLTGILSGCGGQPSTTSSSLASSSAVSSSSKPASGVVHASCPSDASEAYSTVPLIPIMGRIEAENYDLQGYSDSSEVNEGDQYRSDPVDIKIVEGGYGIGWMVAGEWLEYTIHVEREGDYEVTVRSGSIGLGRAISISQCGDVLLDSIDVPIVADWGQFKTWSAGKIHLQPGYQKIRVTVTGNDFLDLDWLQIGPYGGQIDAPNPEIIGATPAMGWNSWNTFGCNISESLIKQVTDAMVSNGMKDAGYEYVNMDDCWMNGRDGNGKLKWDTSTFPSGIPALAQYVHDRGMKLGIYQSANQWTCVGVYGSAEDKAKRVGSLGYEEQDAASFAEWGIDYLKYDLCAGQRSSIIKMGQAIRAQSRPILYSINPGNWEGDLDPPKPNWDMAGVANIWRIGFDINTNWSSVIRLLDQNAPLYSYAGPGGYNDPDMLEVGKLANANEDRAHFALWAIMASPLIAGNDVRNMNATTRDILINQEIIAVNQDSLGIQGRVVATPGQNLQVWSKTLTGSNRRAVVLFNRGTSSASIAVKWSDLELPAGSASVRDLWAHADLGVFADGYTANNVPAHGNAMIIVTTAP